MSTSKKVFLALDNMPKEKVSEVLKALPIENLHGLKLGLEQFCRYGRAYVEDVAQETGARIFLDLKLHDIPNTVAKAIESLKDLPIHYLTVHVSGGEKMLQAAKKAQEEYLPQTRLLGVTYLTSLSQEEFSSLWGIQTQEEKREGFFRLLNVAKRGNLDSLVLSPRELDWCREWEKENLSSAKASFFKVCPGIRFQEQIDRGETQDQSRVSSPESALNQGANLLVMGRSLTQNSSIPQSFWEK